jgi:diguanylate cyclase (GGDEF)-like protein
MTIATPLPDSATATDAASRAALLVALQDEVARLRDEVEMLTEALEALGQAAQRDVLTPLYNRRYFLSALHRGITRVRRYGDSIAAIYVDVDRLKRINDAHGHAAGDAVLVAIAHCLVEQTRESDVVARIGGDEFAILIDRVDGEAAQGKIAQLNAALAAVPCAYNGTALPLSASFGFTMIGAGDSAEELLSRADRAMYADKRRGDLG